MPRFSWMNNKNPSPIPDLIELSTSELNEFREEQADVSNTDSEVDSETLGAAGAGGSPEASSTASDSPTPTNSVQDRSWAVSGAWQGLVSEEQRQLLGKRFMFKFIYSIVKFVYLFIDYNRMNFACRYFGKSVYFLNFM